MEVRDDKRPEITHVTIFGREYTLQSDESPEYTSKIADFVDRRMTGIASEQNLADPTRVAIMAAMDIADQLLRRKEQQEAESERVTKAAQRLGRSLDGTDRGADG